MNNFIVTSLAAEMAYATWIRILGARPGRPPGLFNRSSIEKRVLGLETIPLTPLAPLASHPLQLCLQRHFL